MIPKNKKKDWKKIKDSILKIFIVPKEERTKREEEEKKNGNSNDKTLQYVVFAVIVLAFAIAIHVVTPQKNQSTGNIDSISKSIKPVEPLSENSKKIESEELTKFMIDKLNKLYVKVAPTKLGGQVAYTTTLYNDIIPEGYLEPVSNYTKGYITTILMNGYPYVSKEEMGVESDEEAYIATQLAIYEYLSRVNITEKIFSLDKLKADVPENEEKVQRIVTASKVIVEYALKNPYENEPNISFNTSKVESDISGEYRIIGPIYIQQEDDERIYQYLGIKNEYKTSIENLKASEYYKNKIVYVDENGNELKEIKSNEPFYIKLVGEFQDEYFVRISARYTVKTLSSEIYSTANGSKSYVILNVDDSKYSSEKVITNTSYTTINVIVNDRMGKPISGVEIGLYNEKNELISTVTTNVLGEIKSYVKEGTYYIKQIDVPDGYILNGNDYKLEISKGEEKKDLEIINDSF